MEFTIENVGDWFNGLWALQNRSLFLAIVLTALLLILEIQITILVLRIAYETHAKELTLKKVLATRCWSAIVISLFYPVLYAALP